LLPSILLVDADPEAGAMVRDALLEGAGPCELRAVASVEDLDAYVRSEADPAQPRPTLVLIDLDLPDDAAIAAIAELKKTHRRVPVVALTRTADPARIAAAYDAGANTVLPRPVTFLALVRLMKVFTAYWLEAAALP
jgi:two-component system response regulator